MFVHFVPVRVKMGTSDGVREGVKSAGLSSKSKAGSGRMASHKLAVKNHRGKSNFGTIAHHQIGQSWHTSCDKDRACEDGTRRSHDS